jgi:hypothetical protein
MTPEQALKVLTEATRALQATRDQHQTIIMALETLRALIENQESSQV